MKYYCEQVTDLSLQGLFIVYGAGASESREHLIGQKIWWEAEVRGDVKKKSLIHFGGSNELQALNAYIF